MKILAIVLATLTLLTCLVSCASVRREASSEPSADIYNAHNLDIRVNNGNSVGYAQDVQYIGVVIIPKFYTINDLETYIYTNSKNMDDYSIPPVDIELSAGVYMQDSHRLKDWYIPIWDWLGLSDMKDIVGTIEHITYLNQYTEFSTSMDNISVYFRRINSTLREFILQNEKEDEINFGAYDENAGVTEGYLARDYEDTLVLYKITQEEGKLKKTISFAINDFYVSVTLEDTEDEYPGVITDLFSGDDAKFEEAMANVYSRAPEIDTSATKPVTVGTTSVTTAPTIQTRPVTPPTETTKVKTTGKDTTTTIVDKTEN